MIFPSVVKAINWAKREWRDRDKKARIRSDANHDVRTDELITALFNCGIPLWIAKRNAKAFMCLRPDFDLKDHRFRHIRKLLEFHHEEFVNAAIAIGEQHGRDAGAAYVRYIRDNDIFFARIAQLPHGFEYEYLFGG